MENGKISLEALNALDEGAFVDYLCEVYEHSPWVIEAALFERPFSSLKVLQVTFEKILYGATLAQQYDLIKAHPDLAVKLEALEGLTDFSQLEQRRAGFAALSAEMLGQLRTALKVYADRFGHPFILCVSEHPAVDVLSILNARLSANAEAERLACLFQIARIGWHRTCSLVCET